MSRTPWSFLLPLVLAAPACEPADAPENAAAETAVAEADPADTSAASDPCGLIPVEEWAARTGYDDIRADRSAKDTCDYLSDDLWGVVGSVVFPGADFLENAPSVIDDTEPLQGLGDAALWVGNGPVVRRGATVLWINVHPSIDNQRDVALELARLALAEL